MPAMSRCGWWGAPHSSRERPHSGGADTKRTEWGGYPAILSPTNVLILFNKVAAPPDADPLATAYWHFGWNPPDQRKKVEALQAQGGRTNPSAPSSGIANI